MSVTWIEASAGTGKTYTLVQTVVGLVKDQGRSVDQILLVTFTEKATAELKTRVRAGLRQAWKDTRDPRLSQALEDLPSMMVTTIHGFCRALLGQFPLESGVSFTPELVDQDRQWRRLLRDELRPRLGGLDAELLAWAGLEDEEDLLDLAAQALNRGLFSLPLAHPTPDEQQKFDAWRRELSVPRDPGAGALPQELSEKADTAAYFKSNWYKSPYAAVRDLLQARTPADLLACLTGKSREALAKWDEDSTIWKKGAPPLSPFLQALRDAALQFCQTADAWSSNLEPGSDLALFFGGCARHRVLADLCLPVLNERSATELTYHDLIDRVRRLVTSPEGAALNQAAASRWTAVLIDEFQDTDPEQWDIFSSLFLNEDHDLVLVGDPKQSIYRFRGADLNLYRAVRDQVKAQGTQTLVLDQNFRSTAAMIEAVNQVFDPARGAPWDHPEDFHPSRKGDKAVEVLVRRGPGDVLEPVAPLAAYRSPGAEGDWHAHLAATVLDLLGSCLLDTEGVTRAITPGDFLILVRRKREAWSLFRRLSALGVPATVGGSGGLLASREAQEILLFLKALESPRSVSAAGALAWTRPFRGTPVDTLLAGLDAAQADRSRGAYLRAFRVVARGSDPDGGGLEALLAQPGGPRLVTNLEHVLELVQERHHQGQVPRGQAALALETWIEGRLQEDEVDLRRDGEAPTLRLMTIHAAKGLEAPIVLHGFPGESPADRAPWLVTRGVDFLKTPASVAAEAAERQAEDLRLRYVALTRARAHQVLCVPDSGIEVPLREQETRRWSGATESLPVATLGPALTGLADRHPWVESHSGLWRRATRDDERPTTVWDRPRVRDDETSLAEPSAADTLPAGPAFGDLVHDILEAADFRGWAAGAPEEARRATAQVVEEHCLARRGLFQGRDLSRPLGDWLGRVLATPLSLGTGQVTFTGLAPEDTRRELEFHLPLAHRGTRSFRWGEKEFTVHQGYLTGRIDLVFRVEDRLYLADWKTNRLAPGQTPRDLMAEAGYDLQAQWYWEALRRLAVLQGETLEPAGVLYVFLRGAGDRAQGVFLGPGDLAKDTLTPFLGEVARG